MDSNVPRSPAGEEKRSCCSNNICGQAAQGGEHRGNKSKPKHIPVPGELNIPGYAGGSISCLCQLQFALQICR